jgi:hypothetical protein
MRILLAAKHAPHGPRPIGGVQTWCRTVAAELKKRGHDVETWGPGQSTILGGFDLGIMANVQDTHRAWAWCRRHITVCHGIIPAEKPGGGRVVFTSEEVRDHWGEDGPIIRQPIDTEFWSAPWHLSIFLTRFSYRRGLAFVPKLADKLGLRYNHLHNSNEKEVRNQLCQSACVLATGRAALEAMSCNVPVVICDHRAAYQPALMDVHTAQQIHRNYSGRGGVVPVPGLLEGAVVQAMGKGGMRDHVLKHHDVKDVVDQLLELM